MANRYPHWSRMRQHWDSTGQMLLAPLGMALGDIRQQFQTQLSNQYLASVNLDELSQLYRFSLPKSYQFSFNTDNPGLVIPLAPKVIGFLANGTQIEVDSIPTNTIEELWYDSLPMRIEVSTSLDDNKVLVATAISDLDTVILSKPSKPNRLLVSLQGGNSFFNGEAPNVVQATVELKGITKKGLEETEILFFFSNIEVLTFKEWQEITSVAVKNVAPATATLEIKTFDFKKDFRSDISFTHLGTNKIEKLIQYTINQNDYLGSTLQENVISANDTDLIAQGISSSVKLREHELLDVTGNTIVGLRDIAIQKFSDNLYAIDNSKLYIFDLKKSYPNISAMEGRTFGPQTEIEVDCEDVLIGDTITLTARAKLLFRHIIKY